MKRFYKATSSLVRHLLLSAGPGAKENTVIRETRQRTMTAEERGQLAMFLARYPSRMRQASETALVGWAAFTLGFVTLWAVLAWICRMLAAFDFGWHSNLAVWIAPGAVVACGFASLVSTRSWMRSWKDIRPLVRSDIAAGVVAEELLRFTEAKRFQEPEHGGLVYFLRTEDDKVFALFDHESQDLGVDGKDPLSSCFSPRSDLLLVRAQSCRFVLSKTFFGNGLPLSPPKVLSAPPKSWPQTEEFCEVAWQDLEQKYSA